MIKILTLDNISFEEFGVCQFEDYHQLFDHITEIENDLSGYITEDESAKLVAYADRDQKYWRFTIYSPHRVSSIYTHNKDLPEAVEKAFEEQLSLIEICTGDYNNPQYIVRTPNVDVNYLKKQWCIDYCAFHNMTISESRKFEPLAEIKSGDPFADTVNLEDRRGSL